MKKAIFKIAALLFAISVIMSGCTADIPEETEVMPSVTEAGSSDTEEFPKVFSAEELYEVYPVKIVYDGDTAEKISVETVSEEPILLYNDLGMEMGTFKASYPQITDERYGAEVREKINAEIKKYRDERFESAQNSVNLRGKDKDGNMSDGALEFYETARDKFTIAFRGDSVGENFFCVYFLYSPDVAAAAPTYVYPAPMVFDTRTGERVYFEDIAADKEGLVNAINEAAKQAALTGDGGAGFPADKYAETIANFDEYFNYDFFEIGYDKDGKRRLVSEDMLTERFAVHDGCIGFYYTYHDFGANAGSDMEGNFAGLPIDEGLQYLTDEGKEIFAGYRSAETVPAKVIEYKGERFFDVEMLIPYGIVDKESMTEGDREFVKLFENARNADYYLN